MDRSVFAGFTPCRPAQQKGLATPVEGPGQDSAQSTFLTRGASALHNVESIYSATLSKTLSRQYLFGPLASLDVSGQWPVFMQEPHLTEVNLLYARGKNLSTGEFPVPEPGVKPIKAAPPCIMAGMPSYYSDPEPPAGPSGLAGKFEIGTFTYILKR